MKETDRRPAPGPDRPNGPVSAILRWMTGIIGFLLLGWLLAIVVEWIGLLWWWREEGILHAQQAMAQELAFLGRDSERSLLGSHPAVFARRCADTVHFWLFEWTGLMDGLQWLAQPAAQGDPVRAMWHGFYGAVEPFVLTAILVTQTYVLRLAVLILSSPTFILSGAVGLAEGLMRRDLRRWGGGRESSFAHGAARLAVKPLVAAPWLVYLSLPITLHPAWIIMPASIGFGVLICVASSTFKKYI